MILNLQIDLPQEVIDLLKQVNVYDDNTLDSDISEEEERLLFDNDLMEEVLVDWHTTKYEDRLTSLGILVYKTLNK